jgi:hypothetical protein
MLGSPPADLRDASIIANNTWVVAFDNLSGVRPWFSDMLCRLAYGTGFQTRTLCSNDELTSFEGCRPIIINGIDDLVTRHDLLSRAVVLNCPTFNEDDRRPDDEFWVAFEAAHPRILGALLDAIVGGLATLPSVGKMTLPRMATFGRWGEAVSRHLGRKAGAFLDAFLGNQQSASAELLEDSPLVSELTSFGRGREPWQGTSQQLLEELTDHASTASKNSAKWPRGARSLSCMIRRLAPGLRKQCVDVQFTPRLNKSRLIKITWQACGGGSPTSSDDFASLASLASPDGNGKLTPELPQVPGKPRVAF